MYSFETEIDAQACNVSYLKGLKIFLQIKLHVQQKDFNKTIWRPTETAFQNYKPFINTLLYKYNFF